MEFVLIEAEIDFDCQLLGILTRIGTMRTLFWGIGLIEIFLKLKFLFIRVIFLYFWNFVAIF